MQSLLLTVIAILWRKTLATSVVFGCFFAEWFRSTLTLQDDPCKKYYEVLVVNPILLVSPTKAFTVTITTLITDPLKHIGQGISEFLVALLKDLPVTLQIPVFLVVMLCVLVLMYGSVQAAFQHGITAPFRHPRRDPPPLQLEQPQRRLQGIEDFDRLAEGDAPQHALRHRADDVRLDRNQVHQRQHNRPREERAKVVVVTVRTAETPYSEDEMDAGWREADPNLAAESDSGNQEELAGASSSSVDVNTAQSKAKPTESDSSPSNTKPEEANENLSKDELNRDNAASRSQPAARRPSQTDVQDQQSSAENKTSTDSLVQVETVGVPVQESSPISAE